MITSSEFNTLRIESLLSGTFAISKDDQGIKWAVIGDFIIDMITLKLLLLWRISKRNTNYMWRNATTHAITDLLKKLNPTLDGLESNYKMVSKLYFAFGDLTRDQTNRDLIDRYEQYVDKS